MTGLRSGVRSVVRLAIITSLLALPVLAQSGCINLSGASCHGQAEACHGQACANVLKYGCTSGPGCFGPPCSGGGCFDTCASYDEVACGTHTDCKWDPSPSSCIGGRLAASCEIMDSEHDCKQLSGCSWDTN